MTRRSTAVAVGGFIATAWLYLVGSDRAFDYDSAVTMHNFVRTDSLLDPFTKQVVFNNHPLFSFLDHLVYTATGSADEVAMRLLPIGFSAATVGLMGWWATERWGAAAGMGAAMVLATSPLVASTGRDVRGYSLLLLMVTMAGIVCLDRSPPTHRRIWLFGAAIAIGVATHLYMVMPFFLAVVWLAGTGRWDRRWRTSCLAGVVVGALAYVGMSGEFGRTGRVFRPAFPRELFWDLLGASALSAAALGVLFVVALVQDRPPRTTDRLAAVGVGASVVLMVLAAWLLAPTDLYSRFFVWLVPGIAAAVGWALRERPERLGLVLLFAFGSLGSQLPGWSDDDIPNRALAAATTRVEDVCSTGYTFEAFQFYDPDVRAVPLTDLAGCRGVALLAPDQLGSLPSLVARQFPVACPVSQVEEGSLRVKDAAYCPE